jgi:two-component system sensor histidine kinase SenX3
MAWFKSQAQRSGISHASTPDLGQSEPQLGAGIEDLLLNIDAESIIIAQNDSVILMSPGIHNLNMVREFRLTNESLMMMVRAVRRFGKRQEATLELPRGPIGGGTHDLLVRVVPLGNDGVIAILIFDDSEMRRLDSIRRDFVANISHELKTPIGALSILSEAVLGAADDPEAIAKFATRMQTESKRLSDLVQEIINLSRLQDEDPLKNAQDIDLRDVLQEAIDQSQMRAESRQIDVVLSISNDCTIKGDRSQVLMAISNLIENAINYSPEGTRVAVTLRSQNGLVEISVTDQGIGIPEKDLERIFERFYRVDPARSRQTGGTGLGLSIVKHVATNHGGDVAVWSVAGAGSTFTLRFPEPIQLNAAEAI